MEARLLQASEVAVVLELRTGKRLTVAPHLLSANDRQFLDDAKNAAVEKLFQPDEAVPAAEQVIADFPAEPGKISAAIPCKLSPDWSYFVYLPKTFRKSRQYPVSYLMDPGGGKVSTVQRYVAAAERLGVILIASREAKNGFGPSDEAVQAMVADVKSRLPVLAELSFASGFSGGSRMAYLLAETDPSIAGILACGSGMGVYPDEENNKVCRLAKLRSGLPVCSLMGTNCFNRDEAVSSQVNLDAARGKLTFFSGKHAWASPALIADGFSFVLGVTLKDVIKPTPALREQQLRYSRAIWQRTMEADIRSWDKADWMAVLAGFPGEPLIKTAAAQTAAKLAKDPEVLAGRAANDAVSEFAKKHYALYEKGKSPNLDREAEAEKIASKFQSLPQAEILRMLAKPKA
jgi:dienelactone hydrolase